MHLEQYAIRENTYTQTHTHIHTLNLGEKVGMMFELFQKQISEMIFFPIDITRSLH